jgi:hypothetical protein
MLRDVQPDRLITRSELINRDDTIDADEKVFD